MAALCALVCPFAVGQKAPRNQQQNRFAAAAANWAPPDIDAAVPPVDATVPCALPAVVQKAGERVQEMVTNLLKFSATERMEHAELTPEGEWRSEKPITFEYMVETREVRAGMLVVHETRDDGNALEKFPAHLATLGLPALALVFHPYFSGDYEMTCEGQGNYDGFYAWVVRFQQRPDKLPRLRSYRIKDLIFPVQLKGRAWISTDNYQVLHIETDLLAPVPAIQLLREHLAVDYRPVHFRKADENLWLQQRAEVYFDYRGHRYRRVHSFSDFKLFTVDTEQTVKTPKEQ
jgi:hypothetical protein